MQAAPTTTGAGCYNFRCFRAGAGDIQCASDLGGRLPVLHGRGGLEPDRGQRQLGSQRLLPGAAVDGGGDGLGLRRRQRLELRRGDLRERG